MTLRAYVAASGYGAGVTAVFVDEGEGQRRVIYGRNANGEMCQYLEEGSEQPDIRPFLEMPDEWGRVLLDALIRHYNGGEDTRSLRRDYDAERARVDRLIAALIPARAS